MGKEYLLEEPSYFPFKFIMMKGSLMNTKKITNNFIKVYKINILSPEDFAKVKYFLSTGFYKLAKVQFGPYLDEAIIYYSKEIDCFFNK